MARVLIVEDNPDVSALLKWIVQRVGADVDVAERGTEALRLYESLEPDLVLLDIDLPGMNGLGVLKRIAAGRARGAHDANIVMVSARDSIDDIAEAMDLGARDFVVKPITPAAIEARIRKYLPAKSL
jgi:DNA-binding response OmpR family regulator